jgi:hypothetical protein
MDIKRALKLLLPRYQKLILEYRVDMKPRYGYGKPPHSALYDLINANRSAYQKHIASMLRYINVFNCIKLASEESNDDEPVWDNGFLPGLDVAALYTMLAELGSATYVEIGSGNSTKVARKSIKDNELSTRIISIDPFPRANIDHLADRVIRKPLEDIEDYSLITQDLKEGDILFVDNSHRVLPNSDVNVFFLELLPALKPGVVVHIHDIYLPYDYPLEMCNRFYSEQYMLAAFLLGTPQKYEILFPGHFVTTDRELSESLAPLWHGVNKSKVETHGESFWLKVN